MLDVVSDYDVDQMYPVYGFGGKLPGGFESHCFALNGNILSPEVNQLKGVLSSYVNSLKKVDLYGPTNFSEIINFVNNQVHSQNQETSQANQKYTILLILTDGVISDMPKTIDAIVKASSNPLSIVIVGIG